MKESSIAKTILKKNRTGVLTLLDFKRNHKSVAIKTIIPWPKDKHRDLWNKIERQLIFDKVANSMGKGLSFQEMVLEQLNFGGKKINVHHYITLYTKIY